MQLYHQILRTIFFKLPGLSNSILQVTGSYGTFTNYFSLISINGFNIKNKMKVCTKTRKHAPYKILTLPRAKGFRAERFRKKLRDCK